MSNRGGTPTGPVPWELHRKDRHLESGHRTASTAGRTSIDRNSFCTNAALIIHGCEVAIAISAEHKHSDERKE